MDPFRDASIRAAWRADFEDLLPLDGRAIEALGHRRGDRMLKGLARLFGPLGRFRGGRDTPDALGLQPFVPPL